MSLQGPAQDKSVRGVHEATEQTSVQLRKYNVTISRPLPCTIRIAVTCLGKGWLDIYKEELHARSDRQTFRLPLTEV